MTREEASIIIGNIPINGDGCYSISEYQQAKARAIAALEQQPCEMTVNEYRNRLMDAFHNADCDELIAVVVRPEESEFKQLEWLLKNHYHNQKQQPCDLNDAREDFMHDVYNTLDFLPTNNEANRIIDSFDRVTSGLEQQPCEDYISRKDMLAVLRQSHSLTQAWDGFEKLPSVTLKEKTGKWIDSKDWIERHFDSMNFRKHCSLCNHIGNIQDNFCPNCGARMIEPQESEVSK